MAEKDVTEKVLLSYNDVFADIVNVLLFHGEQIIDPNDLTDQTTHAMFKADGKIREMERDVAKRWTKNNIRIACIGMENQTAADPYMPLRVMGYDGAEYQTQLRNLKSGEKPSPVITLVLYFGYKGHWNAPKTLVDALQVPDSLKPYVTDARINLFEIAYLSWDQVNMFKSDFKEVASYFVQLRETGGYKPSDTKMKHFDALLSLFNVMDRDHRFETAANIQLKAKEVETMSEWLSMVIDTSVAKGRAEGKAEGKAEGVEQGILKGKLSVLSSLVGEHVLTVKDAAKQVNMTEAEFIEKAGI